MKKFASLLAAVLLLIPSRAAAADAPPEETDYGAAIAGFAEGKSYASFATAVFSGEDVLYSGYFGYSDMENQIPADKDTVYEWGSVSKLFVWISAMQLYERGELDLNADIRGYLPEDFFTKLAYDDPITMLDLMNHSAGWQETIYPLETADEKDIVPLEEALRNTEPPQVNRPGEICSYSNWGAALAGLIVERISGTDYAQYVRENILQPLGMEQTSIRADYNDNPWVRAQREKLRSYIIMDSMGINQSQGAAMSFILLYPAGSAAGTLGDITKFAQAFVTDNSPLFENRETLELMLTATMCYGDTDIPRVCHGLWSSCYGVDTLGHNGNTQSCSSNLTFDKESGLGAVVITNQYGESTFCPGIPALVFGDCQDGPHAAGGASEAPSDISGTYVTARSYFKGFPKICSSLNLLPLIRTEDPDVYDVMGQMTFTRAGNDLFIVRSGYDSYLAAYDPERGIIEFAGGDYIRDDLWILKFILIIIFIISAVTALIMMIVKLIRKIAKKSKPDSGAAPILSGQISRVISVAAIVVFMLIAAIPITKISAAVFCVIQGACASVCLASAILLVKCTAGAEKRSKAVKYIFSIICNVFVTGFIIFFELANYWSC